MPNLPSLSRQLLADRRGTSTIELAILAPIVGALIAGLVDTSMGFAEKMRLEQSAARAIERATAHGRISNDYSHIRSEAAAAAGVPSGRVTLDSWLECDGARQVDFTGMCSNGQQIARFVSVSIAGSYRPLLPYNGVFGANQGGSIGLTGDASVRLQ